MKALLALGSPTGMYTLASWKACPPQRTLREMSLPSGVRDSVLTSRGPRGASKRVRIRIATPAAARPWDWAGVGVPAALLRGRCKVVAGEACARELACRARLRGRGRGCWS